MFQNPGGKIKSFAVLFCGFLAISSLVGGIVAGVVCEDFWIFLLIFLPGLLVAYLGGLLLYGFGELIDSTEDNRKINKAILDRLSKDTEENSAEAASPSETDSGPGENLPSPAVAYARNQNRMRQGK